MFRTELCRRLRVHSRHGVGAVLHHGAVVTYLQNVIGYPIITAGLLLASRGCGTPHDDGRPAMGYIEARTLIIAGLSITCLSLFT